MGDLLSKPPSSSSNPSSTSTTSEMSSSNSSRTQESKHENEPTNVSESQASAKESSDPPIQELPADLGTKEDGFAPEGEVREEGGEEEEGECGFCLFMKGGGCRDEFIEWQKCVEEGERDKEDVVERCAEITGTLTKCMMSHRDYYGPLLRAEEEARKELEEQAKEREEGTNESEKGKGSDESRWTLEASATGSEGEKVKGSS